MRNSEKIILLGQTLVSNQNFITLRVTVDKPHATHWLTLTTQGLGAPTASFSVSYIYGGQTTLSTQKSQLIKPNLSNIVQRSEISNKAPFKFFIDYWSGAKLSRVDESAERTLELPSLFLSLFCICSLQNRVVFWRSLLCLACHAESSVTWRDKERLRRSVTWRGKERFRPEAIDTYGTLAVDFFTDDISGGLDEP